ncbi:MAG: LamG-like jellyroll fold domain-containing protein [Pirellulales bacterium]|nr:LamG-like jellyroll fold domain-containing protein [Pirellulales bacterium]
MPNTMIRRSLFALVLIIFSLAMWTGVQAERPVLPDSLSGAVINFDLSKAQRLSLAIYQNDGRLVRTLFTGAPHTAGKHTAFWDGMDRYGNPLPPGDYSWKLLATTGLRAEYLMQIGQNVDPAWERATGNHEAPVGAAIDSTGLYRVGAANEGAHYAVKTDLNGKHLWVNDRWSADPWAQPTLAITLVNGRLYELMPNGDLYGYDAKTGKVFTGGDTSPQPWNLGWEGYTPPPSAKDEEKRMLRIEKCPADLAADASGDLILAAFPQYDAVCWYSGKDGKLIDTAKGFTKLAGIAGGKDGIAYAISGGAVVSFTRDQKEPKVVISADQLLHPWRLAADPKSGNILVAENSLMFSNTNPRHQVKRFDSSGNLLKEYGLPAGRGDGVYVPTNFRGISDIEADHEGGFIVTEGHHTPPRRTARFDAEGRLLREWYGAQHYGVIACPEPADPRFVWTLANAPQQGLVRWEVDYAKKTWRVAEVYQDVFASNPFSTVPQVPDLFEKEGRVYIQGGALHGGLSLVIYDPKAKTIRPCVASSWRDNKRRAYLWVDLNDDGQAADNELDWMIGHQIGGRINPLTLTLFTTPAPTDYQPAKRFDPENITQGGTPIYRDMPSAQLPGISEAGGNYFPGDYRHDPAGNTYGSFAEGAKNPHEGSENHGAWYYNSCSAIDRLVKWDNAGKLLWSVGRHSPDNDHETGSTAMARGLVGLAQGCVIWGDASDEETARPTVWTEDGLYVDELLRVPTDYSPKEAYGMYNANEYPCGRLHTDPKTGEVLYFALNSGGGAPIYRITGWEGWHRQEGKFVLHDTVKSVAKRNGTGLIGEYFNTPDCSGSPVITREDQLVYFNWGQGAPDKAITADTFSARWTGQYEAATNEDLRFEVRGNFPWRDRGKPTFTKLWLNGHLVIDSTQEHSYTRVRLAAGQRVDLKLECGFKKGEAAIALSHDTPSLDRRAVLPEFLHPTAVGEKTAVEVVTEKRPEVLARFNFEDQDASLFWSAAGGDVFGRLTGDARRSPGQTGHGIELTAKGEFGPAIFAIDEELRLPDTNYSVAFWFKTTAPNLRLCEAKRYSSYNNRWSDHTLMLEGGKPQFRLQNADPIIAAESVNDGEWHHVVSTVGDGGHRLYLDGRLAGAGNLTRRTSSSNRLGLDLGPGGGTGTVIFDDVLVLGRVLSAEEVRGYSLSDGGDTTRGE